MARKHPLYLIFQWHMHQPFYNDQLTGEYRLPWTRLHATKDYTDMIWHLERHPGVKGVMNFVPSLLAQITDYHNFSVVNESHLNLTRKPAEDLSVDERVFVLQEFFHSNFDRMIATSPRYLELFRKRGDNQSTDRLGAMVQSFTDQDFRDLQVWFLLAWSGQSLRQNKLVQKLLTRGREFTEEDKRQLLDVHQSAIQNLTNRYNALRQIGQIEISGSPFAHPILPLLVDSDIARICMPGLELPAHRFRHPEEAERQVRISLDYFRKQLDWKIAGMWPSEGSVSEDAVKLMSEQGIRWISTDSNVLARSLSRNGEPAYLSPEIMYQPYRFNTDAGEMNIFFRDQMLSDLIGFQYASRPPGEDVADFMNHLEQIDQSLPDDDFPYVTVVTMDGENAWEHFESNGLPFFDKLYESLGNSSRFDTTTFSDYLDQFGSSANLEWLHPGSWINADFHIWIGHPEKNAAWDALNAALQLVAKKRADGVDIPEEVEHAILQAEGSDWFWWYGDHNNSAHDEIFDQLFCHALIKVYQLLDEPVPEYLER